MILLSIRLNPKSLKLDKGKAATLKVTIAPKLAKNAKLVWKSSRPKVAAVNAKGRVTAKRAGTTKITVTAKGSKKSASCTVKVLTPVSKVTVSPRKVELGIKERITLKTKIIPTNASYQTLVFQSMDPKVVAVNRRGILEGRHAGETKVVIQVKNTTVTPENATDSTVFWSSSNEAVATVDAATGLITAVAEGTAKITVTTKDGQKQADCEIKVEKELLPTNAYYSSDNGINWKATDMKVSVQNLNDVQTVTLIGKRASLDEYVKNYQYFKIGNDINAKFDAKLEVQTDGSYQLTAQPGTPREKKYPVYYEKDLNICSIASFTDGENVI